MADHPARSPLDSVGGEIIGIVAPVSACMLLVVLLVSSISSPLSSLLPPSSSSSSSSSSSFWDQDLEPALVTSLVFVVAITLLTFLLVLLFYLRCTSCLRYYLAVSSFVVPLVLGGRVLLSLASAVALPLDAPTFAFLLLNLAALAAAAVSAPSPIAVTQASLVAIAVLVAFWFTALPEWTTWALLLALALYDLAAVLLPVGPLRLLLDLAISRDEELPALVYEARPVHPAPPDTARVWRAPPVREPLLERPPGESLPPVGERPVAVVEANDEDVEELVEGIGLGATGAIKLGLGDFIFYSVLVGRAAMYDYLTVYACYLAIVAGLGITLLLLAVYRKALPALPVSIALGVVFYFATRTLLEVLVVQCSVNLMMF